MMKHPVCLATLLMLHFASCLDAQGTIPVTGTVEREIAAGTAHTYTVQLAAGEYVATIPVGRSVEIRLQQGVDHPTPERFRRLAHRFDDFFSETVTEVFVLPGSAQIGKRRSNPCAGIVAGPSWLRV